MAVRAHGQITLSSVIDVKATYRYYLLQSSTLTKPAKPTKHPPSGWSDTEPIYTEGSTNSLYFVDCTVFNDDTFVYSEVSLSNSYEAEKVAYNKAVNAQNGVTNLTNRVTNAEARIESNTEQISLIATKKEVTETFSSIRIGSRNLIRNSKNLIFENYAFTSTGVGAVLGSGVIGQMVLGEG